MTTEIVGMPRTLYEASFGAVSRPVGAAIEALLKVDRFIGIAYLIEGKLYGTSLLAMARVNPIRRSKILENSVSWRLCLCDASGRSPKGRRRSRRCRRARKIFRQFMKNSPIYVFLKMKNSGLFD